MTIRDELESLRRQRKVLQAETVMQWAKVHTDSALHQALDWNDTTAAIQYRLMQVRQLIAIHVVSVTGVRELISLKIDRVKEGGGYRGINDVMAQPDLREMYLAEALQDLERLRLKYEQLVELARVWLETDRVKANAGKRAPAARRGKESKKAAKRSRPSEAHPA